MANEVKGQLGTVSVEDRAALEKFARDNADALALAGMDAAKLIDNFAKSGVRTAKDYLAGGMPAPKNYARAADDEVQLVRMLEQSETGMKKMGVDRDAELRRFRASGKNLDDYLGRGRE